MATEEAVFVSKLTKNYGKIRALKGLSFKIDKGEIYGLIGPNGAGKTTTLRILATLISPDSGVARVFGYDVVKDAGRVRAIISYLPEEAGAYRNLSGLEYLKFMASFYASDDLNLKEMVDRGIKISGLGERINDKVKTYSKGMKKRLVLARALMVMPKLAILDEPTSGLDVTHAYHVRRVIRRYVKETGLTVLLSSHNMLEVETLCDRVGLLHKGKLVEEGPPDELKEKYGAANLEEVFVEVTAIA
ncbi:MAG TPA: ABC transporter ATP-binding protein [Candidatus Korarchaeota archaeon]|nr:ABC transporter ATP-binding protein [Candidatus Korarchaeota archaeon]